MQEYFRPIPIADPADVPGAMPLAGGPLRFALVERLTRDAPPRIIAARDLTDAQLAPLVTARAPISGLGFAVPRLMGILNVTPDSFSDGGAHDTVIAAVARARAMLAEGADLIDVGGESTRPGALETPAATEIARVAPVIAALRADGFGTPISLDTRKAAVARAAGADIINDVSGLRHDPALAGVAADTAAPLIVMHSLGTPETMQAMSATAYDDVVLDVYDALAASVERAEAAGVARSRIMIDPGIGFGKTDAQNLAILRRISLFHGLGCAILLGVSRKGMIGRIADQPDAAQRGPGSAGIGLWAIGQGIQMLRVHDIALHKQMIRLWQTCAIPSPGQP
jgi:dihydropteroate synthase